jgi:UDP-3-O-acyl-N-acetylglucosamine deacetylase
VALSLVRTCRAQPRCETKIRGAADALAFCLMNDLDFLVEMGFATGGCAAQICENARAALSRNPHVVK